MVDRGMCLLDGGLAVEERQYSCAPSVALRDPEKGSMLKAPQEFKTDHVRIESLRLIEIVDAQCHLS
jgi:hypothetical protein